MVGNCIFYIHVLLLLFFFVFMVVCVPACVLSAQLWLAEGPERVKQQRDKTMTETRGKNKKHKQEAE